MYPNLGSNGKSVSIILGLSVYIQCTLCKMLGFLGNNLILMRTLGAGVYVHIDQAYNKHIFPAMHILMPAFTKTFLELSVRHA